MPIKQELTPGELAFVESHRDPDTFPELELVQNQRRLYPRNGLAAHVIGYVGEVSEQELNTSEFAKYSQGDIVGKFGLERQYNDMLMGVDGQRRVVVDSLGREHQRCSKTTKPRRATICSYAGSGSCRPWRKLSMDGKRGAVVALDPRNGEVLAMVSRPAFDPNVFTTRIRAEDWKGLTNDPNNPLMNRAIQAQFAPGSTFKPIVTLAALETGTIDESFTVHCGGGAIVLRPLLSLRLQAWDARPASARSCTPAMPTSTPWATSWGSTSIAEYAQLAGFGKKTGIDLPGETEGVDAVPEMEAAHAAREMVRGRNDFGGDRTGRGDGHADPARVSDRRHGQRRRLVQAASGQRLPSPPEPVRRAEFRPENIATVVSGMYGVVNEGGTGETAQIPGIDVCGKTGTAQRISMELAKSGKAGGDLAKENGWFVGFAPRENPEIVVVALFEASTHGYSAAPIVRDVIKSYFDKKLRQAQPSLSAQTALFQKPR